MDFWTAKIFQNGLSTSFKNWKIIFYKVTLFILFSFIHEHLKKINIQKASIMDK